MTVSPKDMHAKLAYEAAVYREQLRLLKKEMDRINVTTVELSTAVKTIENLISEETLVPVGGGAFIKGEVRSTQVLVPIGGSYLTEMEKERAAEEINKRIETTKKATVRLNEEYKKITEKLKELGKQLQQLKARADISKRVDESAQEDYI